MVIVESYNKQATIMKNRKIIENSRLFNGNIFVECKIESEITQELPPLKNRKSNKTHNNMPSSNSSINAPRKRFKCPYCDYFSRDRFRMKEHMEGVHLGIRNHKCGHCEYTASSFKSVKRHISAIHQKVKKYKCKLCEYAAGSGEHLRRHVKAVHHRIKKRKCEYCGFMTNRTDLLNQHIDNVHHKDKILSQKLIENYTCELCESVFMNYASLKRHILTAHEEIENDLERIENIWDFNDEAEIEDTTNGQDHVKESNDKPGESERYDIEEPHVEGFKGEYDTKLEVQVRDSLLENKEDYLKSSDVGCEPAVYVKKEMELKKNSFNNNISTEINEDKSEIKRELSSPDNSVGDCEEDKIQNEISDGMNETCFENKIDDTLSKDPQLKKIRCEFCHYSGRNLSRIRDHMNAVHLGIKNHKCDYCDYAASQYHYIKRHIQIVHQKIKNHKCEFCDYSTNNVAHVKRHVATVHQKLKSHKCKYCRFTATRADNLRQHVQIVHLNNKNYRRRQAEYAPSTSGTILNDQRLKIQ